MTPSFSPPLVAPRCGEIGSVTVTIVLAFEDGGERATHPRVLLCLVITN